MVPVPPPVAPAPALPAPVQPPATSIATRRRWWPWLLLGLAVLVLLPLAISLGGALAVLHYPAALPALLRQVPGLALQGLQSDVAAGQLRAISLTWQLGAALPGQTGTLHISGLAINGARLQWAPHPGAWLGLRVASLTAQQADFQSGRPATTTVAAPTDLQLPLALQVDALRINQLQVDALAPITDVAASLQLGAQRGGLHRVDGLSLVWQQATLTGAAQIGTSAPLPVQASLQAQRAGLQPWSAKLTLKGPLARLAAEAQLDGWHLAAGSTAAAPAGKPASTSLSARATLLPFATWPLGELTLHTQQLDLAALLPSLPRTALTGSATLHSNGLDSPASANITLDNQLPGAWDSGRLPLRSISLQASGTPRQTNKLTLDHVKLVLAGGAASGIPAAGATTSADNALDAGQISGSGRWAGDTLALDLQVSKLQPARLHSQAAALLLDGTVLLRASGLPVASAAAGTGTGAQPGAQPAAQPAASVPGASTGTRFGAGTNAATNAAKNTATNTNPAQRTSPQPLQLALDAKLQGRLLDGSGLPVQLRLVGQGNPHSLQISQAEASSGPASAKASLDARQSPAGWHLRGQAKLSQFDPRPWWRGAADSAWRRGPHRLEGELDIDVLWRGHAPTTRGPATPALEHWLAQLSGNANATLRNSLLAGVPLAATLRLHSQGSSTDLSANADLAGNQLTLTGQRAASAAADHWALQVQAPALAALAPLGRLGAELVPGVASVWPSAGQLSGELQANGRWPHLRTDGTLRSTSLDTPAGALQNASLAWHSGDNADAPLSLQLSAQGLRNANGQRLDKLQADLSGSLRKHTLLWQVDSPAKPPLWTETLLGPAGTGTRLRAEGQGSWTSGAASPADPAADARTNAPTNAPTNARTNAPTNALTNAPTSPGALLGTWRLQDLQLSGGARDAQGGSRPWLAAQGLSAELRLRQDRQLQGVSLAPGRVQLLGTSLVWQQADWAGGVAASGANPSTDPSRLTLLATLEKLDGAALLARLQPSMGWGGQLQLGGRIEVRSGAKFDADIVLERLSGDLTLTDELGSTQALGVTDLRLALTASDGQWQFAQGLAGRNIGSLSGAQVLRTAPGQRWPSAASPLQGVVDARVDNLGIWGTWVPPGWRLTGNLRTSASLGGTWGAPEIKGQMVGSKLGVRNLLQGINLTDGDLALSLSGETAQIDRFTFKGGDGQLTLTGGATLGAAPGAKVHLVAEHFRLLGRLDRRLVASGSADLQLDTKRLLLDGGFTIDEGLIDLSQGEAAALDSDVVVHRSAAAASAATSAATSAANTGANPRNGTTSATAAPLRQAQVAVKINLGQKLRLRGLGVDTGLRGELQVSSPGGRLALRGVVRTEGGTVAAYGQKLEIERGAVTFTGALDNPQLDVLAIRPNLDQRVGVLVVGPAQNPRIRLYAEPDLADYDKLSWLVLGRAPDGLGRSDTALLQRAAVALLAGNGQNPADTLLENIGLTDFSVRQSDGDTRETIVSLGKQLSQRWYLGYERSVNATTGSWQLIYRVAQRFTLRAQSGTDNAVDAIWTVRW